MEIGDTGGSHARPSPSAERRGACSIRLAIHSRRLPDMPRHIELVGEICEENAKHDHMPDFSVRLDGNNVRFTNRKTMKALPSPETTLFPTLDLETYNDAMAQA